MWNTSSNIYFIFSARIPENEDWNITLNPTTNSNRAMWDCSRI